MAILTTILDEFRTPTTVAILERQQPYGDSFGGYTVKSIRRFPNEAAARAAFAEAKKIRRTRISEVRK